MMTDKDLELIDLAESTTYRSTILRYIDEADTDECRNILKSILDESETIWEEND